MILEVITENSENQVPSQDDLIYWADTYGLTMPVLADANQVMWSYAQGANMGGSVGLPFTVVLDPGVDIYSTASGTQLGVAEGRL